jgi:uncharacterized membrane protein
MIFDILLNVSSWLLQNTIGRIPDVTIIPSGFVSALSGIIQSAYGWNWLLPVQSLLIVLTTFILIAFAEFSFFIAWFLFDYVARNLRR